MKYAVSVTDTSHVQSIEKSGKLMLEELERFSEQLRTISSYESPRGIVFHDVPSATELYSTIPLPAYTSRDLIHLHPVVETWKELYRPSAAGVPEAERYYDSLTVKDVAVIAAHELTHHADVFHSEFETWEEEDARDMWFEEGLCFYIPRTLILSKDRCQTIMEAERLLIDKYKEEYGTYPLDQFGAAGYRGGSSEALSAAFYDYWRSTHVVSELVEKYCGGSVHTLLDIYREWVEGTSDESLQQFFVTYFSFTKEEGKALWLM